MLGVNTIVKVDLSREKIWRCVGSLTLVTESSELKHGIDQGQGGQGMTEPE